MLKWFGRGIVHDYAFEIRERLLGDRSQGAAQFLLAAESGDED